MAAEDACGWSARSWRLRNREPWSLAGIAHDFNNLLTVILGNASIILEEAPPKSLLQACATTVVDTCHRASDLTRQMLAYSGKGRFVVEPTDLNTTVKSITSLVESALPKLITLRYELGQDLPGLDADRTQLQQVILNLVTNAGEAMAGESMADGSGIITLRTGFQQLEEGDIARSYPGQELQPGPYLFLDVTDSGKGMDEATKARIFEPFFTTKATGRGLGLAAIQGSCAATKAASGSTASRAKEPPSVSCCRPSARRWR